jgi:aldehyde dehydrogenase (NAD+)
MNIQGTWNLPVVMPLYPFVAALAAGNAIILKPSEISYHTSSLLEKLMPQYLDSVTEFFDSN